jgi:hypothetical protein
VYGRMGRPSSGERGGALRNLFTSVSKEEKGQVNGIFFAWWDDFVWSD